MGSREEGVLQSMAGSGKSTEHRRREALGRQCRQTSPPTALANTQRRSGDALVPAAELPAQRRALAFIDHLLASSARYGSFGSSYELERWFETSRAHHVALRRPGGRCFGLLTNSSREGRLDAWDSALSEAR